MSDRSNNEKGDGAVPGHVAIIMDGNGRWAGMRGFPRMEGHRRGAGVVRTIVETAGRCGVRYLTLFGFSSENWNRPPEEVHDLMALVKLYLRREVTELNNNNIRFLSIGDRSQLTADILEVIRNAEKTTENNNGLTLLLALSYGGRADIVAGIRSIVEGVSTGRIDSADITEGLLSNHLSTADIPDPDLLIRTGGEQRISNFLLWQMAYTEFVFLDCYWPEFGEAEFRDAIASYGNRDRRFGKTSSN